jgi:hypothetical protein
MASALRIFAIILGASLIIGETIRSYGQDRELVFVVDDYLIGGFLVLSAVFFSADTLVRRSAFAAAWATTAGMLYGSFFGKVFPAQGSSMRSNIPDDTLTILIGVAFATAIIGMIATIALPRQQSG